jgi:hypothetical protein
VRDERNQPGNPGLGPLVVREGVRPHRKPPPLHGRESHIRIFDPDNDARKVYGETQRSRDGSLPHEEHGPSAVLKALDPFWTRGIIPEDEVEGAGEGRP